MAAATASKPPLLVCPRCAGARRCEYVIRSTQEGVTLTCPACSGYGEVWEADCWNCGETVERPQRATVRDDDKLETTCDACLSEVGR